MGNKNIKNNFEDNKNYNNTSLNDIETESDNKNINYKEIEFPLNNIQNVIKNNSKDCTNCYTLDPYIEIEYDNINNIPSIYRCPVCLCIPFIIYKTKICYLCNCGYHKCSVEYFLTNFISYPINAVNLKNYDDIESSKIYFCQVCSKFIIDREEHLNNYYGHPIKNINNIFQKTEEENYNYYEIKLDNYIKILEDLEMSTDISPIDVVQPLEHASFESSFDIKDSVDIFERAYITPVTV
jgi:hypothetical protein